MHFMKRTILIDAMILVLLTGCANHISSFQDVSTKAHFVRMNSSRLAGGFSFVTLNAQRYEKQGETSYSLFVVYAGPTFINIDAGKSLILLIDGQRHELAGRGSAGHRILVSLGLVEEKAYYHDIDPELIRQIAYAKKVEVVVKGSTDFVKRYLKDKNFSDFKNFHIFSTSDMVASQR